MSYGAGLQGHAKLGAILTQSERKSLATTSPHPLRWGLCCSGSFSANSFLGKVRLSEFVNHISPFFSCNSFEIKQILPTVDAHHLLHRKYPPL